MPELFNVLNYIDSAATPTFDVGEIYETIAEIHTTIEGGSHIYEVVRNLKYAYTANKKLFFRTSSDNGTTWDEIEISPKDTIIEIPFTGVSRGTFTNGVVDLLFQARKDNATGTLDITAIQLYMKRIG